MLQYSLQIYFISLLYASILINSGLSEKKWPAKNVPFPEKKCQSLLTNCFCYDVYPIAALVCNNMMDFTRFNRILQSGEIFEVNTTYEITFTGIKNVPAGILQGLIVNRFILDAPDATVDEKIFQGVISLRWYHVRQSMCEGAPDFSFVKDSIKRINIDSSVLTCLGGTYLQNLTAIIKLSFFNNSIRAIESDVFKGTQSVLIVDLSYNLLTSLPLNLLDCVGTESVLILDLFYNLLTSLPPNHLGCMGTQSVLILDLSYNLLTSLPPNLLDCMGTESVLILDLSYNLLTSFPPNLLDCMGTESVLILDLSYNLLTSFPPNLLDCMGTESVLILDLFYNLLTSLPPNHLGCMGTQSVLILDLSYNLLTSLPPNLLDCMGTESVLILDLSYNLLTSFPPNLLDCMGTESVLILDLSYNLLTSFPPNLLDCMGTESVLILDLSYNLLTSLPPNLLDHMVNLTKFVVSHNNLLHVNGLFSVTHPKHIYLDFNNITDADSVLHHNMDRTVTLALASNPISKISVQSFNGKIRNVKFLFLDHCDIRDFNVSHYRFPLQALDLSYNLIEEVSNQEIDIGYNLELDLIGNQIRKFDATISSSMKRLYLSENKLQILNTTLQLTQMDEVQVARNQLQYLTNQDLRGVHNTYNLEFQQNQISRIDTGTFAPITNDLHYLDLSYNLITSLNRSVRMLSQLKLLNLTHNLIQTFASDEFTGLNELSELYLQYNKIQAIGQLQYLEKLQYLVITHNSVELITPEQVPRKLRFMYLAGNPLKCVCNFQPFLLWLNASDSPATDIDLCLQQDTENSLHGLQRCPSMCSCSCANNGNVHFMYVNCSSQNLTVVPPFLRNDFLDIQNNTTIFQYRNPVVIDQNVHPSLHIEDYALGINLENNNLEFDALEKTKILPNLLQLYLADNNLERLPMHMIDNLRRIQKMSLSGNPWDCDCDALRFKKWLTFKYDVVQDINNTRCGISNKGESKLNGRVIWTLTDLDICPADIGLIVSVSFGILTLLLVALATKVLYTKYELNIKVYLYSRGFTFVKEEDLDHDKTFDAFISFSNHDGAFVRKEIISEIEGRDPNIRLCVHLRNFIPGEFIYDNIIWAVQNSKRTVLILTKKFLESEWCLYEFRAAHLQALEDKVHRIIVIKVGDLPEEIDPKIKVYLDSTTYLTWGDKNFWKNLLYVLPTSSTPRDPKPKSIREIIGREFNLTVPS